MSDKEEDSKDKIDIHSSSMKNHNNTITLSKSTFYKLCVIGIIALMSATFFAGYSLHSATNPSTTITTATQTGDTAATIPVTVNNITVGNAPFLGPAEAKVTIVEFSDFQCPFCATFFSNTLSQLKSEYIDTGKIRFVYKHYPLEFHLNAKLAAVASECAQEQGKFWEYHDILMQNQTSWEVLDSGNAINTFLNYAQTLGLDTNNFKPCLENLKYERNVDMDLQQGYSMGVTGTPAFFVGSEGKYTLIEGAQPIASFRHAIDDVR